MLSRWAAGFAAAFAILFAAPAIAAPPLDAYGKLPGVDMAALSPSGSHYAIVGEVEGARLGDGRDHRGPLHRLQTLQFFVEGLIALGGHRHFFHGGFKLVGPW